MPRSPVGMTFTKKPLRRQERSSRACRRRFQNHQSITDVARTPTDRSHAKGPLVLAVEAPARFAFALSTWAADEAALPGWTDGVDVLGFAPGRLEEEAAARPGDLELEGSTEGAAVGRPSMRAMDFAVPVLQTSPATAPTCCQVLPVTFSVVAAYVSCLAPWLGAFR